MSQAYKPFAFDRVFAEDGTVLRDGDRVRNVFTREEAESQANAAAEAARNSAEAQASKEAAEALKQLTGRMHAVLARMDSESAAIREDAARLAGAAAAKIAGKALGEYGAETITECVREALSDLRGEPRIAVRVAPHLADTIAERLHEAAEAMGFEGAVVVRPDEEVASGDCQLEWRAGVIERTAADIETRIGEAIEKWLARPADETQSAPGTAGGAAA